MDFSFKFTFWKRTTAVSCFYLPPQKISQFPSILQPGSAKISIQFFINPLLYPPNCIFLFTVLAILVNSTSYSLSHPYHQIRNLNSLHHFKNHHFVATNINRGGAMKYHSPLLSRATLCTASPGEFPSLYATLEQFGYAKIWYLGSNVHSRSMLSGFTSQRITYSSHSWWELSVCQEMNFQHTHWMSLWLASELNP